MQVNTCPGVLLRLERSLLQIEEGLHNVFEWCGCNNNLLVNPGKTKNVGGWYASTYESIRIFRQYQFHGRKSYTSDRGADLMLAFKIGLSLDMKRLSRMSKSVSEVPVERILKSEGEI